jgi:endoglucanase
MGGRLTRAGVSKTRGFSTNVSNFQTTSNEIAYGNKIAAKIGKTFVVDTSRNGQGAKGGEWCNPDGRGLGKKPTTTTGSSNVDAFLWIKRAGESDGQCGLAGAPAPGQWFPAYAQMLINNAKY